MPSARPRREKTKKKTVAGLTALPVQSQDAKSAKSWREDNPTDPFSLGALGVLAVHTFGCGPRLSRVACNRASTTAQVEASEEMRTGAGPEWFRR
jgi:hypothetical protein